MVFTIFLLLNSFVGTKNTWAATPSSCKYEGQCIDNAKCHSVGYNIWVFAGPCGSAIIGRVESPVGVKEYNTETALQGNGDIGILNFINNVIQLLTAVGGLFILINLIIAGFTYITQAGNSQAASSIKDRLTYAVIGVVIMVASYTLIAVISWLIFGNPTFIINPDLTSLGALAP